MSCRDRGCCSVGTNRSNATIVSAISEEGSVARSNRNGETHCFHCGEEGHWANVCPLLFEEQQSQLQMNIIVEDEAFNEENNIKKRKVASWESKWPCHKERNSRAIGFTSITDSPSQPSKLPSISLTSRPKKRNAGELQCWEHKKNRKGEYGRVEAWYMSKGTANIFSMNEIEKLHCITYDSIDGY